MNYCAAKSLIGQAFLVGTFAITLIGLCYKIFKDDNKKN